MASGGGIFTKRGRCYPYWEDLDGCMRSSNFPAHDCIEVFEDYMECLHKTKQTERLKRIQLEAIKIKDKELFYTIATEHPSILLPHLKKKVAEQAFSSPQNTKDATSTMIAHNSQMSRESSPKPTPNATAAATTDNR